MTTIATWNVNSIKARLEHVLAWLKETAPDIALLQELKCIDEAFPREQIEDLGYNVATHGQKTYNGVAILSKFPLDDVVRGLPGDESDEQARYIEAVASLPGGEAVRIASVYVPNGQEIGSDKFAYKLAFFERLKNHLAGLLAFEEMVVIGGDYNVAPTGADVYAPEQLAGSICFHPDEQAAWRRMVHLGYSDAYRLMHPEGDGDCPFSWWDYRAGGWQNNKGLRIDHHLLSPQAADRLTDCSVQRELRDVEKASDHAPVLAVLT